MDYTELDEKIVAAIRGGRHPLHDQECINAAQMIDATPSWPYAIDRRLQLMRKRGVIQHIKGCAQTGAKGWVVK